MATVESVSLGSDASSTEASVALGSRAMATVESVSLGSDANSTEASVALGSRTYAGETSISIGTSSVSDGLGIAVGTNIEVGKTSIAIGNDFKPSLGWENMQCNMSSNAIAIGNGNGLSQGQNTIVLGSESALEKIGNDCTCIGGRFVGAYYKGQESVFIGTSAGRNRHQAVDGNGDCLVGVGNGALIHGGKSSCVSLGYNSGSPAAGPHTGLPMSALSVAIGGYSGCVGIGEGSVMIGYGASTLADHTIVLDSTRDDTNRLKLDNKRDFDNAFYVRPMRAASGTGNSVVYNKSTGEMTYSDTESQVIGPTEDFSSLGKSALDTIKAMEVKVGNTAYATNTADIKKKELVVTSSTLSEVVGNIDTTGGAVVSPNYESLLLMLVMAIKELAP